MKKQAARLIENGISSAEGKAMCRVLFDGSPEAIFIADPATGLVVDANLAAEKMIGRPLSDIIGMHHTALHPPELRDRALKDFTEHMAASRPAHEAVPLEYKVVRADGSVIPVEIMTSVIAIGGKRYLQGYFRDISQQKLAAQNLRESEEKFRLLAEKSLIGVYLIQDGKFRYTNPVHARIFGYADGEITGKLGPRDLVFPEDWPLVEKNILKRTSGELAEVEYSFRGVRKDGVVIYVEVRGARTEYMGRPAVIGTIMDVTERKHAEEALKESEERYRTLVDTAQVGILVHNSGIVRFVNRRMTELLGGSSPEELCGRSVLDFIHPDFRQFAQNRIKDSSVRQLPQAEEKLVSRRGDIIEAEVYSSPISFQGSPCALVVVHDITARRRAEAEMKKAHRQLLDIIEFLPDATFVVDRAKRFIAWNRALERMTGVRKEEILGKGEYAYSIPFHGERRPILIDLIWESRPELEKLYDFIHRDADGTIRSEVFVPSLYEGAGAYVAVTASPLLGEDGRRYGAIESVRDISDRKRAQADVQRLNTSLERRVTERTAQLEEANRELEGFAYSAAHDLKSPLRHINIFAEILEQESGSALTQDSRVNLQNIKRSADQLGRLIESLLSLASAGSKPLALEKVDLTALAAEAREEVSREAAGRAIDWRFGPLPEAFCDRTLIKQVLVNMLGNSVKYTRGKRDAAVSVDCRREGEELVICVKDNGAGFAAADSGRLFGFFQRLHKPEDFEGSGIGLSTVKRIVLRHGGRVWAESLTGGGAAFYFTLPVRNG